MMNQNDNETLAISLGSQLIGYLTHNHDGKNIFVFSEGYIEQGARRPTLSLSYTDFENSAVTTNRLRKTFVTKHALPSFFSNLLPEGSLKDYIIAQSKIHPNDEFSLLKQLGNDLPGNIRIQSVEPMTEQQLAHSEDDKVKQIEDETIKFSLAGIQMKFSMRQKNHRYTISYPAELGDYIVKTPSILHKKLPQNEYTMMRLAQGAGVDIPEVMLIQVRDLDDLPPINLPGESHAYAIKRFDRVDDHRIHIEDFAQVLGLRPQQKYRSTNYDTMGRVILSQSQNSQQDIVEFIRRITVNVMLGNTDAHIKNWSLIYHDSINPTLAPAYDIVSSLTYINDRNNALNLGGIKYFYDLTQENINRFIRKTHIPANLVNETIEQTREAAIKHWPTLLRELPVTKEVGVTLKAHLKQLQEPFRIVL